MYDKECTVMGFSYLSGINTETLYAWHSGNGKYKASAQRSDVVKKLTIERENSLSDKLHGGKCNPVGVLAILNHFYGWSGVGNMQEDKQKQTASLTDAGSALFELSDNSPPVMISAADQRQK